MSRIATTDKLRRKIDALEDLTREELVERWQKAHGCLPPKGIKRNLLLYSAAWQLQTKHLGGLRGDAKSTLRRLINAGQPTPATRSSRGNVVRRGRTTQPINHLRGKLAPGVRLVREWNGRMHVVEVIEDGFCHDGKTYRSLTAVAKRITGTQWSGPRFFGL